LKRGGLVSKPAVTRLLRATHVASPIMLIAAATTNVVVRGGVVELWGVILDERQREALRVAAENISGVKSVKDHLVWVEPTSGMFIEPREEVIAQ
jgi:hypothetical protein